MKALVLVTFLSALIFTYGPQGFAKTVGKGITCTTPRMEKVLSLNNGVTIYNEHQMQENRREIASIANVRTRRNDGGVIKSFSFEGQKYEIHIKNTKNFNEADDYLTMTSSDGHQMTYPITCQ